MNDATKDLKTVDITKIHTTEMTLETREKNINRTHQNHLQVSTEFLGGRFDTKG